MARLTRRSFPTGERGNALIEFALVLPILVVVFAAMVDFGFMFQRYLVATNAAREGARIRVLPGYLDEDAQNRAIAYYKAGTGEEADPLVAVSLCPAGGVAGLPTAEVTLTATHNYLILDSVIGLINGDPLGPVTLTARATMRIESGGTTCP